jgi:hypothetical protein
MCMFESLDMRLASLPIFILTRRFRHAPASFDGRRNEFVPSPPIDPCDPTGRRPTNAKSFQESEYGTLHPGSIASGGVALPGLITASGMSPQMMTSSPPLS